MINGERVLGTVLARGGSRRLPNKNLRPIAGDPLIAWTIRAARASHYMDRLIVSTDSDEIARVALGLGCEVPFRRPEALARDDTTSCDTLVHALTVLGWTEGFVVLLQPTSPLRQAEDIDTCLEVCCAQSAPACVSIAAVSKPPSCLLTLDTEGRLEPLYPSDFEFERVQSCAGIYQPNGAVYVARVPWFLANRTFWSRETMAYVMPTDRSIDIDTEDDLRKAADQMGGRQP